MLKSGLIGLAGALVLSCAAFTNIEPPFLGDARPPRSVKVGTQAALELAPGEPGGEIVVAENASKMTRFAASELQSLLKRKLGRELPIVNKPSPGAKSIFIGVSEFTRKAGIDESKFCRDSFLILAAGNRVYIAGRDDPKWDEAGMLKTASGWKFHHEKGTLFGVYDLLERFGGAGFFFSGPGTVVPKGKLVIPECRIFDRPDFECRLVQSFEGTGADVETRTRDYSMFRLGTFYTPCCHGLAQLGYYRRFGKTHPEYFALDSTGKRMNSPTPQTWNEQFCYSGPYKEEIYADAKSCLLNEPASKRGVYNPYGSIGWDPTGHTPGLVFCAHPGDSYHPCHCPQCLPHMKDEQSISDFQWGFTFDLAERLIRENVKGWVTNLAYTPYRLTPSRPIPPNVLVQVAETGPWGDLGTELAHVKSWQNYAKRRVWLWNYCGKFGDSNYPGIPNVAPIAAARYYKAMAPYIFGAFIECETDRYAFNRPMFYIFGKTAWDAAADPERLMDRYCEGLYGPAAPEMRKFFRKLESLWIQTAGKRVMTALGPVAVKESVHSVWTRIYTPAERAAMTAMLNRAEALAAKDPGSLERVRLARKEYLDPMIEAGKIYDRMSAAIPHFRASADQTLHLQRLDGKPGDRSTVRIEAGTDSFRISFDFTEPEMDKISAPVRKPDDPDLWRDDSAEIFLNPDCGRKNLFQVIAGASGGLRTYRRHDAGGVMKDVSWSPKLEYHAEKSGSGWKGVLTIPYKALEMTGKPEKIVANFCRNQVKNGKCTNYSWSPFLNMTAISPYRDAGSFGTVLFVPETDRSIVKEPGFSGVRKGPNVFGSWHMHGVIPAWNSTGFDSATFISHGVSMAIRNSRIGSWAVRQDLPDLKPNAKYRLSFFVKADKIVPGKSGNSIVGGATVNIMDDANRWFPATQITGTTPWIYQEFVFKTGPDTNTPKHRSYLLLYLLNASGTVHFDEVRLEPIE